MRRAFVHPRSLQRGVGLVEVMIAMAILLFGALVLARMQVGTLTGLQLSAFHLAVDRLSSEMIETLRTHADAASAGHFDHEADSDPADTTRIDRMTTSWRGRVASTIPTAATGIACADGLCQVQISWLENIDGAMRRQNFRTSTPL